MQWKNNFEKRGIHMKCGSKRYLVEMKINGIKKIKLVPERTSAGARKAVRREYDENVEILSVREEKRNT